VLELGFEPAKLVLVIMVECDLLLLFW
jgi:hypothetical protein